jgi:hypothetical protein
MPETATSNRGVCARTSSIRDGLVGAERGQQATRPCRSGYAVAFHRRDHRTCPSRWLIDAIGDSGNATVFGPYGHGGSARMIAYPMMLWLVALGGYLMAAAFGGRIGTLTS